MQSCSAKPLILVYAVVAATSAVASSLYGLVQTHPEDTRRPLVDFDIALTFIPALLLGVSFGGHCPLAY